MAKRNLTPKQRKFADEYIATGNAEQSAKEAGYSARGNTSKLLQNTTIAEYIDKRMAELEEQAVASQTEVLKYLTRVMRREEMEYTVVTLEEKEEWYENDENGKSKKRSSTTQMPQRVPFPAKLSDANKAAELLGKRYAMWTDKQEIEHSGAVQFVDDIGGDDDASTSNAPEAE